MATTVTHHQNMSEISKYENGSTVFAGDNVIDKNKIDKYPIVSNLGSLITQILDGEIVDAFFSVATGAVPTPSSELLYGNVSSDGIVDEFEGPGYVVVDNDKITVNPPGEFVWGYNSPYIQAKIVPNGIDIINNKTNQTIGHIDPSTMNNDTIPGERVNAETLKYWYNRYNQGSKYNKVASTYTYLDSHPQYNDRNREFNARQFVKAWNGTIIPSNAYGCGREGVGFSSVPESDAESGMATHGVCPPARSLRNAVLSLGFSLPIGMDSGRDAVLYGFSPSTGIKINNTLSYPIKINMWTEGSGAGMRIYTDIYEMIPNSYIANQSNSTNSTNSTNN